MGASGSDDSPGSMEALAWEAAHRPASGREPSRLWTDEDPATTIKGMGYRDAATAERTIQLACQPGIRYKTYWSVRAMAERARHHPAQTADMRAALAIFDRWLERRAAEEPAHIYMAEEEQAERQQRQLLAQSCANAHARSRCVEVALGFKDLRDRVSG